MDENRKFEFDVYRTIILGKMISRWGIPNVRRTFMCPSGMVEIYRIPSKETEGLVRYVTFGLSQLVRNDGSVGQHELLLVIEEKNDRVTPAQALNCMCELAAYYAESPHPIQLPSVSPVSDAIPWKPKALLFDEARGEDEDLASITVGTRNVSLLWVVPIFQSEYELINNAGIDEFDRRCAAQNIDLVDVCRNSVA